MKRYPRNIYEGGIFSDVSVWTGKENIGCRPASPFLPLLWEAPERRDT